MRIALISTLATPVRPTHSGSVEAVVWLLSQELTRLGHEVTVFGAAGSEVSGSLVATLPGQYAMVGAPEDWHLCEIINLCKALEMSGHFDVLHSHAYLRGLPLEPLSRAAMLHTLHTTPHADEAFLRRAYPDAWVTAISHYQWSAFHMEPPPVVYHAVDATRFRLVEQPEDYLVYLGRFMPGKGPLTAIEVARRLGIRLLLAGPLNRYYTEKVAPLVDGDSVRYVGSVTGDRRSELLGGARALLYPIAEPEPFGLVMPEAMMCGTPVAALNLGAVPEVVDTGITGYIADSPEELPSQVERALRLDRRGVRARAEARFSGERMAREYEAIYRALRDRRGGTGTGSDANKNSHGGAP